MDLDQALQYGLRSGPAIWIKIRPYKINTMPVDID